MKKHTNSRKFLAGAAATAVIVSAVPAAGFAAEVSFTDVSGHWGEDAINYLVAKGAINGYKDKTFKPEGQISRAEAAKVLALSLGLKVDEKAKSSFDDVAESHWAQSYIAAIETHTTNVINGDDKGNFRPEDKINRQELAKMLVNAYKLELVEGEGVNFPDNNAWGAEFVKILASNDVANGYEDGTFQPWNNVKRAEAAQFIYNAENLDVAPAVEGVTAINPNTVEVALTGKLEEVSKDDFTVVNSATSAKQYVKSAVVSEDGKTVTLEFHSNLTNKTSYTVTADFNGEESSADFDYVVGEVEEIVAESAVIPAETATDLEYVVYDENGLDITSLTDVTLKSSVAGSVNGTKITLNDGVTAFVEVEATKADGTVVKSNRVTVKGSNSLSTELINFSIEDNEPTKTQFEATDFEAVQSIKLGETGKELYLHTEDQYGKYVNLSEGDATFESLNKDVLLADANTGALTARKTGTATVSVKVGTIETVVSVTVLATSELTSVEVDKTEINVSEAVTTGQDVKVKLLDQYGDAFNTSKTINASVVSGSEYVTLDKPTAQTTSNGEATFNLTAVKNGTAVIKFVVDGTKLESSVTFNVQDAGEIARYEVEGTKAIIDKLNDVETTENESTFEIAVYGVDANGIKTGNALANDGGNITVKDSKGTVVTGYNGVGLDTVIDAAELTADETYTLSVVVGDLEVYSTTFTVVDSNPAPTVNQINESITVKKDADLFAAIEDSFEITFDGSVNTDATFKDVTFVSDNTAVVASATNATTVDIIAEGSATIAISEIEIDLDGNKETTADQYVIELDALINVVVTNK